MGTLAVLPFNCVPDAAVNVKFAVVSERVLVYPCTSIPKPVAVMFTILTLPGVMTGAAGGCCSVTDGGRVGNTESPALVSAETVRVNVPATVPWLNWPLPGSAAVVASAGTVKLSVWLELPANFTAGSR